MEQHEIKKTDIMHIGFLKKEKFTGSSDGMRYRIEKHAYTVPVEGTEEEKQMTELVATVWPEPFAFDSTPEDKKLSTTYSFDEDGLEQARLWLNEQKKYDWIAERLPLSRR